MQSVKVKPTPYFSETKERLEIYEERITKKNWKSIWSNLEIYTIKSSY